MFNLFLDVLPYDPEVHRRVYEKVKEEVKDTIDTIGGAIQQVGDSVHHHNHLPLILGGILAALAALGLLLLAVRAYRRKDEQQVAASALGL